MSYKIILPRITIGTTVAIVKGEVVEDEKMEIFFWKRCIMLVLVKANILAIGLGGRTEILRKLPIRLIQIRDGWQAGRSLKNESVDGIISTWDLPDAADGRFLKGLRLAKPYMPVIAIVNPNNTRQEIAARCIGAAAVLSSDVPDEVFVRTVIEVLGLGDTRSIQKICAVANDI